MTLRAMPVREDRWRPDDPIYDGLLKRCAAEAEPPDGGAEVMAAGLVLAVLAVVLLASSASANAAILICGLLFAGVFGYVVTRKRPPAGARPEALRVLGGAGRLPAGYLVHPAAWRAGLAAHVQGIPESQLRAAAGLCHLYPGTVDDLLIFVGNLAIHVPAKQHPTAEDVARRARAMVRLGLPLIAEHISTTPALPRPGASSGKGRTK